MCLENIHLKQLEMMALSVVRVMASSLLTWKIGNITMIIQKVLHANLTLTETREKLLNLWAYRRFLEGVEAACIRDDGHSNWNISLSNGLSVMCELEHSEGDQPNQILFRSLDGNVDLAGVIELTEIRRGLTQIDLLLEYDFQSPIARVVDRMTDGLNRSLDRNLSGIRNFFEVTSKTTESMPLAA